MKSKRGAVNLSRYNAERTDRYLPLINEELRKCKRSKLSFGSIGRLAEYLGSATGIHRTTLTRNSTYKMLLAGYLSGQSGAISGVSDSEASPEALRGKLLAARLEVSNLREQVRRLEAFIDNQAMQPQSEEDKEAGPSNDEDYLAFVDTAMAFAAVLERLQETIAIDLNSKTIQDLAAPPAKRVIVGRERITPFLSWIEKQGAIYNTRQKK